MKKNIKYLFLAAAIVFGAASLWASRANLYRNETRKMFCLPLAQSQCNTNNTYIEKVNVLDEHRRTIVFALDGLILLSGAGFLYVSMHKPKRAAKSKPKRRK